MRTNRQRLDVDHKMNRLHHVRSHRGKVLRLAQKHCSDSSFNPEKTLKLSVVDDPSTCRECLLSGGGSVKNI